MSADPTAAGLFGASDPSKATQVGQSPKSLENLGEANPIDVAQFQTLTGGPMPTNATQMEISGPFDTQANRLKAAPDSDSKNASLGETIIKDLHGIISIGHKQDAALTEKLRDLGNGGMDTVKALEFQYLAGEMQVLTEIVAKGVNKVVQAVQTMARNQ